jgi:hypothetical protein
VGNHAGSNPVVRTTNPCDIVVTGGFLIIGCPPLARRAMVRRIIEEQIKVRISNYDRMLHPQED